METNCGSGSIVLGNGVHETNFDNYVSNCILQKNCDNNSIGVSNLILENGIINTDLMHDKYHYNVELDSAQTSPYIPLGRQGYGSVYFGGDSAGFVQMFTFATDGTIALFNTILPEPQLTTIS